MKQRTMYKRKKNNVESVCKLVSRYSPRFWLRSAFCMYWPKAFILLNPYVFTRKKCEREIMTEHALDKFF